MNPDISLILGILMLVFWAVMLLGVFWPPIGRRVLKPYWPGQFADSRHRQSATRYWFAVLSGQALIALNLVLNPLRLREKSYSILWFVLGLFALGGSLLCFMLSDRYRKQLPPRSQQAPRGRHDTVILIVGILLPIFVLVAGPRIALAAGLIGNVMSITVALLAVACFAIPMML